MNKVQGDGEKQHRDSLVGGTEDHGDAQEDVVAQRGIDEAALTVLSLGTDQPCSTLSDIGRPREVIRFNTRHFTSASTC